MLRSTRYLGFSDEKDEEEEADLCLFSIFETPTKDSKILLALGSLSLEIKRLVNTAEKRFYVFFVFYTGSSIDAYLELFQEVADFIDHGRDVLSNVSAQLSAFYDKEEKEIHLHFLIEEICQLLTVFVILDESIGQNEILLVNWKTYMSQIHSSVSKNNEKHDRLLEIINNISIKLFSRSILSETFNILKRCSHSYGLSNELYHCLQNFFQEYQSVRTSLRVFLLVIFSQTTDKKILSKMIELCKKYPVIALIHNLAVFPDSLLQHYFPEIMKNKMKIVLRSLRCNYLDNEMNLLSSFSSLQIDRINNWKLSWRETLLSKNNSYEKQCRVLLQGHGIAEEIRHKCLLVIGQSERKSNLSFSKSSLFALLTLLKSLKAIQLHYEKEYFIMTKISYNLIQHCLQEILKLNRKVETNMKNKKVNDIDSYFYLELTSNILLNTSIPLFVDRIYLARLTFSFAVQSKFFRKEEIETITQNFKLLELLLFLPRHLARLCHGDILLSKNTLRLLNVYFTLAPKPIRKLSHLFIILNDVRDIFLKMKKEEKSRDFEEKIKNLFLHQYLLPLCSELEIDLRLFVHSHLQLDDRNPFKSTQISSTSFSNVILFNEQWNIKDFIGLYLGKTFYNLSTVALENCEAYSKMKLYSFHKYDIEIMKDILPAQRLEQGLDLLVIMRNIEDFASRHNYNLNEQIFIEVNSSNKYYNTINVKHISNSISTHGMGILNTSVNYTYIYLRKQMKAFSQFLYDDSIKAKLLKNIRYFNDNRELYQHKYPYEKANKFNKGIRKLGLLENGLSLLDKFRCLVSQIGNAMGIVRLIRSGALNYSADALKFIPNLKEIPDFKKRAINENYSLETIEAGEILDSIIRETEKNFSFQNEYFKVLVTIFEKQMNDKKQDHLTLFYAILPALTLNFVEYILIAKEKIGRKSSDGFFTDDGFPMGLAYILTLLNQWEAFDSLHWFSSVRETYKNERLRIEEEQKKNNNDQKLVQTLSLSLFRVSTYLKEFNYLRYNLNSARIFFRFE